MAAEILKQVTGSDKDLLDAIRDGDVEKPDLMGWNDFQKWRNKPGGSRPTMARDAGRTSNQLEVQIWRAVMRELYGEQWEREIVNREVAASRDDAQEAEAPAARSSVPGVASSSAPQDADAGPFPGGSGRNTPVSQRGPGPYSPHSPVPLQPGAAGGLAAMISPGSGRGTPSSFHSERVNAQNVDEVTRKLFRPYDPEKDTLENYVDKLRRQVRAVRHHGRPVDESVYQSLVGKAEIVDALHREFPLDYQSQKDKIVAEIAFEYQQTDLTVPDGAQVLKIKVLEELARERNVDLDEVRGAVDFGGHDAPSPLRAMHALGGLDGGRAETPPPKRGAAGVEVYNIAEDEALPQTPEKKAMRETINRLKNEKAEAELALAAASALAGGPGTPLANVERILEKQTELIAAAVAPKPGKKSTIQINPKFTLPHLNDEVKSGTEVEDFYNKFEELVGLSNEGTGMADKEQLLTIRSCLHGSRRLIYDNVTKEHKHLYDQEDGHGKLYKLVKERLMKFMETGLEKQLRVRNTWNALSKTRNMSALQFEAEWEKALAEMVEVGLPQPPREKYLAYLCKIGSPMSDILRQDRRPRPDGAGGITNRLSETWEELHEILVEKENMAAGSKAFKGAAAALAAGLKPGGGGGGGGGAGRGDGGGKQGGIDKGKGKGKG